MKIQLEIPDDVFEELSYRNLYLIAGIEPIAFKNRDDKWKIKTSACSMYGKCCKKLKEGFTFPIVNEQCVYLQNPAGFGDKWICSLGLNRPIGCSIANFTTDYCTVKYEYVKG